MARTNYSIFSDTELMALVRENDERAFQEIYQRFFPVLYMHTQKRIADAELVKDLLQDIFTSIWKNRKTLHIEQSVSAYIYAAVRFKVINIYQQQQHLTKYLDSLEDFMNREEPVQADFLVRQKDLSSLIEQEVAQLPPGMRRIFMMSRFEQLSHKEIAASLELSEQTVKTQVKKALRILRKRLPLFSFLFLLLR
ncbi:RNA polymerase sigma factor [Sphingobacterium humi]|uniref:RNA polymerase sigma-70 factor n=1 Tax=Sphingobacterium humi TaxID=1796905 RepID=A0A6N8L2G9_9SPHI|nr:RNA polymerase sigma-70 factor [Sphingobacterium humi]MVZ62691.1 RNA polymerase sigma-70 factor [Sphingobacterium humi]